MRFKLIACEILFRELSYATAKSPHRVDVEFLAKGLHDIGRPNMFDSLNRVLGTVDPDEYDAVLLGYALCNGGVVGLKPRGNVPLVLPRAHDCITLFLGDKQRYEDYFFANPGTYFKTMGWVERGDSLLRHSRHETVSAPYQGPSQAVEKVPIGFSDSKTGQLLSFAQMVERYGEDNAKYLRDQLVGMPHYKRMAFIEMGFEPDDSFEQIARKEATEHGLGFDKIIGRMTLFENLVNGNWPEEDFLVVQPGQSIDFDYSGKIIRAT
ncbi:MAG: DUF1638 domain-containing protein [Planctomycetaceae bacterium]|nr:DUF1638 domain-containing protein [Planctomycetaceae bacterium]